MTGRAVRFIIGDIKDQVEPKDYYAAVFICNFLIVGLLTLSFFAVFNVTINDNLPLAIMDAVCAGISAWILHDLYRSKKVGRASRAFLAMLFGILTLFFLVSGSEDLGFVWMFCFLIAAFLVFGRNEGLIYALLFCGVALGYYYTQIGVKITQLGYINLVMTTLVNILFLRYYETSRSELFSRLNTALADLKRSNEQLEARAITDALTGAYNRGHGMELLRSAAEQHHRYAGPFSVIFLDIDNFKSINDRYGHHVGDRILGRYQEIFRSTIRKTDSAIRWGGEEFVILCPNTKRDEAATLARHLLDAVSRQTRQEAMPSTASFGVVEYQGDEGIDSLMRRADEAMYRAKNAGGNRIEIG